MAIIYSYPLMTDTVTGDDLLVLTDVSDSNNTKSVKVSSLPFKTSAVDGSGTAGTIPKWSDSDTLTDSIIKDQGGVDVLIPRFIKHDGDTNNLFGFNGVGQFLVSVDATAEDQFSVAADSINIKTDSGAKLAAGPTSVTLYSDTSDTATTTSIRRFATSTTGVIIYGQTVAEGAASERGGIVRYYNNANNRYVGISGPVTTGTNYQIRLPDSVGTAGQVLKLNNPIIGGSTQDLVWGDATGGSATPAGSDTQIQYNNSGSFGAGSFFTTNKSNKVEITHELGLKGDGGSNQGLLKLYCEAGSTHSVGIKGPNHTGGTPASYVIQLPNSLPNVANQILESNSTGTLSWIATPTAGGSPVGAVGSVQYKNSSGNFAGNEDLIYDGTGILTVGAVGSNKGVVKIIGTDGDSGVLKIGHQNEGKYLSLGLGQDTMAADYSIDFPVAAPGSNNKILESNSSGVLSWINTPTGATYSAGDGLDLTGTTFSTDLKANGGLVIESTELAVDLGASSITGTLATSDGGTGSVETAYCSLTTNVTGTLPVSNGGTGANTLTGILKGNGTSAVTAGAGLGDLSNVSFPASTNDASMYIGNGIPSNLSGTPTKNTTVGEGAGIATTTGYSNSLIGTNSGLVITTGYQNTLIGSDAGANITIGDANTVLGQSASTNSNSDNRAIAIGSTAVATTDGVAIGYGASVTASKGIALGRGAATAAANISLGSSSYPINTSSEVGSAENYLEVVVNGTTYYVPLHNAP